MPTPEIQAGRRCAATLMGVKCKMSSMYMVICEDD